jgi:hypothetical protein
MVGVVHSGGRGPGSPGQDGRLPASPDPVALAGIELHDAPFSGGVSVALADGYQ